MTPETEKQKRPEVGFQTLALWSVGLLAIYGLSAVAPWWIFIHLGPAWGLLFSVVIIIPWVFAVQYRPAGIDIGPFSIPLILNAFGVFVSWTLRVI
ncbi:MAG: hypothetical protein HQL90_13575 [Magnetococcales bacterium]|nr:hypothetical protein [Magnetococcales bacterium]